MTPTEKLADVLKRLPGIKKTLREIAVAVGRVEFASLEVPQQTATILTMQSLKKQERELEEEFSNAIESIPAMLEQAKQEARIEEIIRMGEERRRLRQEIENGLKRKLAEEVNR